MVVVRTLGQLTDSVADFRQDQLGFHSDNGMRYVEMLRQMDKAAAEYHVDIPLQVCRMYMQAGAVMHGCSLWL
ncbi:unnamed protein product [Peronospora effusa]|nr:unnamed protein product [Peronospora effusa]